MIPPLSLSLSDTCNVRLQHRSQKYLRSSSAHPRQGVSFRLHAVIYNSKLEKKKRRKVTVRRERCVVHTTRRRRRRTGVAREGQGGEGEAGGRKKKKGGACVSYALRKSGLNLARKSGLAFALSSHLPLSLSLSASFFIILFLVPLFSCPCRTHSFAFSDPLFFSSASNALFPSVPSLQFFSFVLFVSFSPFALPSLPSPLLSFLLFSPFRHSLLFILARGERRDDNGKSKGFEEERERVRSQ